MKKGPHFSSKKSTKKWFYQLPLDVMYAKNRKNHFFVFFGIHYVQPKPPFLFFQKKVKKPGENGGWLIGAWGGPLGERSSTHIQYHFI